MFRLDRSHGEMNLIGLHQVTQLSHLPIYVPVLSEHRTDIELMSCRAGRDVTTALKSLAILPAPRAMVTCSTRGRATGMEATMIDRQVRMRVWISVVVNSFLAIPCTRNIMRTSRSDATIMSLTTNSTLCSNRDTLVFVLSSMISAIEPPTSVLTPVFLTTQYAYHIRDINIRLVMLGADASIDSLTSPALTVVPQRMRAPYSSLGYLRGSGSPVMDAVSMDRMSPKRRKSDQEETQDLFKSKCRMRYL